MFIISEDLMNKILGYLGTKPWTEVNNLLVELLKVINSKKEVPDDSKDINKN